ncbi:MAG: sugar phosphate isomerase/epimerase [Chloroflexi bacterium]|nr:sugar phosphate isomerase/epimerase [Chloroflexota bacterium]MCY3583897.1 sugar phosphate isomerase/epimerase [Chloroflexota bacterium]MCY3715815.1 sugar phosphate isomerase/epimerase [Chloroflexota bacterium]MDE2651900.1 sugar phosphate isomerase/epimerase [Chloroflexota bacterium]MXV94156.1 sugar phosphate isomerase/epimerase [Chloroflexota bacterium]
MRDSVSLSAGIDNFNECLALAHERGLGIELMAFSQPAILDGDWRKLYREYKAALKDLPGRLSLHGAFMDLVSGSPDERINMVTYGRYEHVIRIASGLGAQQVVFHANYIGLLHNAAYRQGWHQRNVDFWGPLGDYAQAYDVLVAIENMWEYEPAIIGNLLAELQHPYLKACIDVGHAHLFSDADVRFSDWLETLAPRVIELHLNNNNGVLDEHHSFDWGEGALDYHALLPMLRGLPQKPQMVMEMDSVADMRASLRYFNL